MKALDPSVSEAAISNAVRCIDVTKVYVFHRNGKWFATRTDMPYAAYHNPLGRGYRASDAYNDYVSQII